jgi:hypothetical protein
MAQETVTITLATEDPALLAQLPSLVDVLARGEDGVKKHTVTLPNYIKGVLKKEMQEAVKRRLSDPVKRREAYKTLAIAAQTILMKGMEDMRARGHLHWVRNILLLMGVICQ